MHRRAFLKAVGCAAAAFTIAKDVGAEAAAPQPQPVLKARPGEEGLVIEGFYPANIVRMNDGSLITENGWQSRDRGRTWYKSKTFNAPGGGVGLERGALGLVRLGNGELGTYYADKWTMQTALGNDTNNWFFRWSADDGKTWSDPVKITLDGLTQGLKGTMRVLSTGRLLLVTYSQFIGSGFDKRGRSIGTYKGVRFATETEGHYPDFEVCRAYYSDDNGRHWSACDGWIMGWREKQTITDSFTEGSAVELKDGRILMIGRTLTGRLYQAFSGDKGHSWWPGAQPMQLAASNSPGRIFRLPKTGDLLIVWNQQSRSEIRKSLRRCRLSTAVSGDEGKTWQHFKNLEAIRSQADITRVPPDPDLSPRVADDQVGAVPDDYALFQYPSISVAGEEVFISYSIVRYTLDKNGTVQPIGGNVTRILPREWFYTAPSATPQAAMPLQ